MANSRARRPVASLTRLSPSRISTIRWGGYAFGDGSGCDGIGGGNDGAEDEAESPIKAREYPGGGSGHTEHGEATSPNARRRMLTRLNLKSRQEVSQAAAYRSGGSTTRKMTSGFNEILGMAGMKLRSKPRRPADGIRSLQFASEGGEDHDEEKKNEEDDLDCVDFRRVASWSRVLERVRYAKRGRFELRSSGGRLSPRLDRAGACGNDVRRKIGAGPRFDTTCSRP